MKMTTTNVLTADQKLAILNGLKVVEFDTRSEEYSVLVADNETTISALKQIGLDENDIAQTYVDGEVRDITMVAFECGADCYDGSAFRVWTVDEKLDMLHELEVIEHDGDGEACYYVLVEKNAKTLDVVDALGFEIEDLLHKEDDEEDLVDISKMAWKIGATWWDGSKFLVEKPDPVGGGRPADDQPPETMPE